MAVQSFAQQVQHDPDYWTSLPRKSRFLSLCFHCIRVTIYPAN